MAFGPAIKLLTEAENRRQFKALGNAGKDLTKANRKVARLVVTTAKGAASGPEQTSAVGAISASATQSSAAVVIKDNPAWGVGAFMGSVKYPQFPAWVGNSWDLSEGTGPYAIKEAFTASGRAAVMKAYQDNVVETLRAGGVDVGD